jgi:serine/threonine protein kinase
MPHYPGLERYVLVEKMGDGAFSNVYRARDTTGEFDQVAIKVVRKFEMNSTQVGLSRPAFVCAALLCPANSLSSLISWSFCFAKFRQYLCYLVRRPSTPRLQAEAESCGGALNSLDFLLNLHTKTSMSSIAYTYAAFLRAKCYTAA